MEFQLSYFKSLKMMLLKCCTQYASKFGKPAHLQAGKNNQILHSPDIGLPIYKSMVPKMVLMLCPEKHSQIRVTFFINIFNFYYYLVAWVLARFYYFKNKACLMMECFIMSRSWGVYFHIEILINIKKKKKKAHQGNNSLSLFSSSPEIHTVLKSSDDYRSILKENIN